MDGIDGKARNQGNGPVRAKGTLPSVLVIDDDAETRKLLEVALQVKGYQVLAAANGQDALEVAASNQFDLVVTDILMPEKDGLELILELKRQNEHLRIVAISGGGRVGDNLYLDIAAKLGANSVLSKPFSIAAFCSAVETARACPTCPAEA